MQPKRQIETSDAAMQPKRQMETSDAVMHPKRQTEISGTVMHPKRQTETSDAVMRPKRQMETSIFRRGRSFCDTAHIALSTAFMNPSRALFWVMSTLKSAYSGTNRCSDIGLKIGRVVACVTRD
jgi:hypothetical protein